MYVQPVRSSQTSTTSGYADRIRELAPHADVRERDCILDDYMRLLKRDVYSVQDELTLPYVALMHMKIDFVRDTYLVHNPETMAWVDFAGMRWYGKVEQTPAIPRAWDFPRPVERLVMFESEGALVRQHVVASGRRRRHVLKNF